MSTLVSFVFKGKKGKKFGRYKVFKNASSARRAIKGLQKKSDKLVRVGKIKSV